MVFILNSNGPPIPHMLVKGMSKDGLGIYIHIPFCIQRCHYCDFATYSKDQIAPNQNYVNSLLIEAKKRRNLFRESRIDTIYFGGGTPSLLEADQISQIIQGIKKLNFEFADDIEITLEVNPATLNESKCKGLREAGVNRISIGCQSFDDENLQNCNREHNVQDTFNTISLAQKYFDNFSLDLLFSLPQQGLKQLKKDVETIREINPPHVSAYCLTLHENHPMNKGRCSEDEQLDMFKFIFEEFKQIGLNRYEISNFAKPGFESRHNNLYWTDKNFWGIGLSAHSYRRSPNWGQRFWNPSTYKTYIEHIESLDSNVSLEESFGTKNHERLELHESLTDFCHTHLRLQDGLSEHEVRQKFSAQGFDLAQPRLKGLKEQKLLKHEGGRWKLTENGVFLSNKVFSELLFSQSDIDNMNR